MKKITLTLTLMALAASVIVHAQGTIYLNNFDADGSTGSTAGTAGIFNSNVTQNASITTDATVLVGTSSANLAPLASASGGGVGGNTAVLLANNQGGVNGFGNYFDGGYGIVSGIGASGVAFLQVEAWSGASTFALAQTTVGAWWGVSSIWSQNIGSTVPAVGAPSPATLNMTSDVIMTQVHAVPEPSTMALAGLGGLAALMFRRKK